jgi:1-deoxy-D-xylulose-5-phosphate synthase
MDRAGLTGPDGPTHHGAFDLGYMRLFPNMTVMAPGDAHDVGAMLALAMEQDSPCSIRYAKTAAETIESPRAPVEMGRAEVLRWGRDGAIICCGTLLGRCVEAADCLKDEGLDVGVINARFVKPIDRQTVERALRKCSFVVTVEEGVLAGGFGSALLEIAADVGLDAGHVRRLGLPDRFVEHGDRDSLLAELHLDRDGIVQACLELADRTRILKDSKS